MIELRRLRVVRARTGVVRLVIPGGRLDHRTARELVDQIAVVREDRTVRAVVLTASSSDFCTDRADDLDVLDVSPDPASALASLRVPIIALIDGACCDVGFELVLAADLRFCTTAASFAPPDLGAGRFPAWGGSQRLTRIVRPAFATELFLRRGSVDAARAVEIGLIHQTADHLEPLSEAVLDDISALAPIAVEFAKEAVHRGAELPLAAGLRLEGDLNHLLAGTSDRAEGLAAFLAKRPPDFIGR